MAYFDLKENEIFLISTKALIFDEKGKLLVLKHALGDDWGGKWGLPGGLVEMKESIVKAVEREVFEEVGLKAKVDKIISIGDIIYKDWRLKDGRVVDARIIQLGYRCTVKKGQIKLSKEHDDYAWVSKEELTKLIPVPGCKDIFNNYLK